MKKYQTLYVNANIITVDPECPRASWVAVSGGRIAALGQENPPVDEAEVVVDLAGKTMLPGLIDSHAHGTTTGFSMNSIDLMMCDDLKDVIGALEEGCRKAEPGEWVFATGLNPMALREGRPPTRWELDEISGDHPVMVVFLTFHATVFNTKAMELVNVPSDMPGVEKNEDGVPLGIYTDDECSFLGMSRALGFLSDETWEKYIRDCVNFAISKGVTTLHSLDGKMVEGDRDIFIWLNIKDTLPIHSVNYFQTMNVPMVKALGLPRIGGCLTLDGTGFERTMATFEPYACDPECTGVLYFTDDQVYEFVSKAHRAGLQVGMHAIGDRAIDQLIRVYERVIEEQGNPLDLRHRVEHFSLCLPRHIEVASRLRLALPMQPVFTYLWDNPDLPGGDSYEYVIGRERVDRNDPFPAIIEAGGVISGGSDSAVTPIDPLLGIHAAANAPNPVRRVSLDDAIKMFTINGAWACHEETEKGSIEVGKLADFTVVDRDPYQEQEFIKDFKVEMTIVEGKTVYTRPDAS